MEQVSNTVTMAHYERIVQQAKDKAVRTGSKMCVLEDSYDLNNIYFVVMNAVDAETYHREDIYAYVDPDGTVTKA